MVLESDLLLQFGMLAIIKSLVVLDRLHDLLALLDKKAIVLFQIGPEHGHLLAEVHKTFLSTFYLHHQLLDLVLILGKEVVQIGVISDARRFLKTQHILLQVRKA